MSAGLINLRQARKAKARLTKQTEAAANRLIHGRTRGEREAQSAEKSRLTKTLDGHLREVTPDGDGGGGS